MDGTSKPQLGPARARGGWVRARGRLVYNALRYSYRDETAHKSHKRPLNRGSVPLNLGNAQPDTAALTRRDDAVNIMIYPVLYYSYTAMNHLM